MVLSCASAQWYLLLLHPQSPEPGSEAMDILGVPVTGKQPHTHEHFGRNPVSP